MEERKKKAIWINLWSFMDWGILSACERAFEVFFPFIVCVVVAAAVVGLTDQWLKLNGVVSFSHFECSAFVWQPEIHSIMDAILCGVAPLSCSNAEQKFIFGVSRQNEIQKHITFYWLFLAVCFRFCRFISILFFFSRETIIGIYEWENQMEIAATKHK